MTSKPVLIDTSAWLFALRKAFLHEIKERIDFLLREKLVLINGIIRLELLVGTKTESEYDRLKNLLSTLENIETNDSLWEMACDLGFKLRGKGVTIPYTDILIATCALSAGCIILHADNHFDIIAQHFNLNSESYVTAAMDGN
ncbi:MAG: PIN domain nuclease [Thermodesulfobacteriota bacterium]|nr:PIN domain nuclease [Thermodesulfobacteriota bacterium]